VETDIVIGLDSSTTATKAIAWTRDGAIAGTGRSPIPLASLGADRYEQNPDDWWSAATIALGELAQQINPERIAAIAVANQRETFAPLASTGQPVRPAIVWLDQRCRSEVAWLVDRAGADTLHRISGKPPDTAPVAYRIAWMLRSEPELFRSTAVFADVHSYLAWRLTGEFRASWASADPLGLFDMERKDWSEELLQVLELRREQLPALAPPCSPIGEVNARAASETGLRKGTLVVAGGGDGQAAGLGVNCLHSSSAYLNLGTAVVSGTYSAEYKISTAWRTMCSCSGEGYYFETSLRAGTFLLDWFARHICGAPDGDTAIYSQLETEAARIPIGSNGLLALPYWGAVMTPYWDPEARGCFVGLSGSHRRGHLYRALLEGIALEQALVSGMIEEQTGRPIEAFIAIGGGAASDLWCRIIAAATRKIVRRTNTVEASSLGAATCAATGAGWYSSAAQAARSMSGNTVLEVEPSPADMQGYRELMVIYRRIYPRLRDSFRHLSRLSG